MNSLRIRLKTNYSDLLKNSPRRIRRVQIQEYFKLWVDVTDHAGILFFDPTALEPASTAFIRSALKPGEVFVDVGANHGHFTLWAASLVGPSGHVYAFEPNPELRSLLTRSIQENRFDDRVTILPYGLFNEDDDRKTFYLSPDAQNSGLSSLTPAFSPPTASALQIAVRRFDTLVPKINLKRLDAIKIDVEGAEMQVLLGMSDTLAQFNPRWILCETTGSSPVLAWMKQRYFSARRLEAITDASDQANWLFQNER